MDEQKVLELKEMIDRSHNIVFFGGAGVSTESGVPDFRSKDGLYNQHDVQFEKYQPEYLLSHSCLVLEPEVYFEFHRHPIRHFTRSRRAAAYSPRVTCSRSSMKVRLKRILRLRSSRR